MRERERGATTEAGTEPGPGAGDTARIGWLGRIAAAVAVALVVVGLVIAFTPRTVAEGGEADRRWQVTVTPGIVGSTIRLTAPDGAELHASGFGFRPHLDATRVWSVPLAAGGAPTTVVVGPTPPGADSVRVTSDVDGVGEARVQQVAWRRVHVTVIASEAAIEELVAISEDGRVLQSVSELPTSTELTD